MISNYDSLGSLFGWDDPFGQQNNWRSGGQAGMHNAYNSAMNHYASNDMLSAYLGRAPQVVAPEVKDCEGCGAPSVCYQHHCEYCRRPR